MLYDEVEMNSILIYIHILFPEEQNESQLLEPAYVAQK